MPCARSDRNQLRRRGGAAIRGAGVVALGLLSQFLGAACAGLPTLPARPAGAEARGALGLVADRPPEGVLRPGDELIVEIGIGEERRQIRARVDARGTLHVGSGRDVHVAGLSLEVAEERVTQAFREDDTLAEVTLLMAGRPGQNVTALGALGRPGSVGAQPGMRVADLIAAAGGVLFVEEAAGQPAIEVADLDGAALVRNGTALPISMRDALRAKPGHNVYVHPGDLLFVPFATENTVSVLGQVGAPRVLPHHSALRLTEALSAAGGVTPGGDKDDIRVVRGPLHAPAVHRTSLSAIADGDQHDSLLMPGDVVFVEDSFLEDAGEFFALLGPVAGLGMMVAGTYLLFSQ